MAVNVVDISEEDVLVDFSRHYFYVQTPLFVEECFHDSTSTIESISPPPSDQATNPSQY